MITDRDADCGDVEDVQKTSQGFSDEADCNIACTGDPIHLCGGGNRLSVSPTLSRSWLWAHDCPVLHMEWRPERLEDARQHWSL